MKTELSELIGLELSLLSQWITMKSIVSEGYSGVYLSEIDDAEIKLWLSINCKNAYRIMFHDDDVIVAFSSPEEATLFKLRFG